jgi:hypothetical protein
MALLEFTDTDGIIDLVSPMPVGRRVMFGLIAVVPLLAPYELLIRPQWEDRLNPPFFFVLAIALGAVSVSVLLVFAAVAGLEQRMRFDARALSFTYWRRAPVVPARSESWSFASIKRVETAVHTWSDGPDSYSVRVVIEGGRELSTGSTDSRVDVDRYVARLNDLLNAAAS